jgi:guanylate cyclase soluble subunit beta
MPEMRAPRFAVEQVTSTSLILHYHSQRVGLLPLLHGILKTVARTVFHHELEVRELLAARWSHIQLCP